MIEYWHWHTLHAGAETYWGGIIPHSQRPGRVYAELARIGSDFRAAGDRVTQLTPSVDVGILFDNPSKWAQSEQPFLVSYGHRHFGRWPAVTTKTHGSGRVTVVGTVPNPALAAALMDWAVEASRGAPGWRPQADTQSVSNSTNQRGEAIHVVHNWSWDPSTYDLPDAATDVLTGEALAAGATIELGSWDVRVLAS